MISSFPFTFGAYTLQSEIGQGGFAVVYVAHHKPSDEFRALKVLDRRFHDTRFIEQFRQEYETLKKLKHPRIVPVLDFGEHQGDVFIAMQWVKGIDLKTRINNSGALPLAAALAILAQVAEALDHVHDSRFVHRDVKSSNILLDAEAQAYLSDFGLMRAAERTMSISQMTQSGNLQGTAEYMSPEQANGQEASPRSDVYSLAIVVYEMLTGELPFTADQPLAVLKMHTDSPPPNPILKRPDLPAALAAELMKALAKRSADRHPSAGAFAAALQNALNAEEQTTAETTLRVRQVREGALAQGRARLAALKQQASSADQAKRIAEAQAKRFEDEANETEKVLNELKEAEKQAQAEVRALEQARREAEARAVTANKRLEQAERNIKRFQEGGEIDPLNIEWIAIPAGDFLYGENKQKKTLPAFQIAKCAVTNAQYAEFVTATKYAAPAHWGNGKVPNGLENHPVVNVSWNDAQAFCKWASCRLPTEEEWEKAARGSNGLDYPWGNEFDSSKCNSKESNIGTTTPVGQYSPQGDSPCGCVDMAGNVWDWTASKYDASNYVLRGGSWGDESRNVRAADRYWSRPIIASTSISASVASADFPAGFSGYWDSGIWKAAIKIIERSQRNGDGVWGRGHFPFPSRIRE